MDALIAELSEMVKNKVLAWLSNRGVLEVASLTVIQEAMCRAGRAAAQAVGAAWREALVQLSQPLRPCPGCGRKRKFKWRSSQPLRVEVLGFSVELPKLYLECGHCDAPGLSVVKLLTGLSSGEASAQLKLTAAYCASAKSYAECRRDMAVHYGQDIERTKLRRLALEVEQTAVAFAEAERCTQLERLSAEAKTVGVPLIVLEADGGKVRMAAGKVLSKRFDATAWTTAIKQAIWQRDRAQCTALLAAARLHRVKRLPRELDKCPVAMLETYLDNNWKHMRFAELKQMALPFVSARAEAQVRVRTKDRFSVAGAWRLHNVEPKATLRSIIADGRWDAFRASIIEAHRSHFERALLQRLSQAVEQRRLSVQQLAQLGIPALTEQELAA